MRSAHGPLRWTVDMLAISHAWTITADSAKKGEIAADLYYIQSLFIFKPAYIPSISIQVLSFITVSKQCPDVLEPVHVQ
jgi:hypothetical protein